MKGKISKLVFLFVALFIVNSANSQYAISIDSARTYSVGDTFTISGIVTSGSELGTIRYMQDATAGIAIYDNSVNVDRGDSITLSGELDEYNQLFEIINVSNYTIHSSNNPLPAPQIITPNGLDESVEGELVKIENCTFTTNPGGTFGSNQAYNFTSNGESSSIYVRSNHPLIGQIVPSGVVTIIGLGSQFSYSDPNGGYQLIPRDSNDIINASSISVISPVEQSNITQSSFDLSWLTDSAGTTEAFYGSTTALGNHISGTNSTTSHQISITSANPAELFYVMPFSVKGSDTAFAAINAYTTQSASSGDIKVYFNTEVDTTVATHKKAMNIGNAIDDTLIAYIDRAKYSIDFTMYNFNVTNISNVATALNNAHSRGVVVRVIYDATAVNLAVQLLDQGIKKINNSISGTGIMHNKFIIFDAHSTNQNDPIVWTGATNLTDGQINDDPNNVIIIQDKSLAIAYTLEFNEMFGSDGPTPDNSLSRFGEDKIDNTPHKFIIGGRDVELYFSPSDDANAKIIETINNADHNMSIATMLITRSDITYAIEDAVNDNGVATQILVNHENDCSPLAWSILSTLLGIDLQDDSETPYIMHHKFMVTDVGTNSNPTLLTGSHNWSNAANNTNDENTLVIFDDTLANIYYQAFKYRFDENLYNAVDDISKKYNSVKVFPNPNSGNMTINFSSQSSEIANINVYDINGKLVYQSSQKLNQGQNFINLNLDIPKGLYMLQINGESKNYSQKFIVE
jgi:phosphatidylserine/phosphatidylglycerophosphate/cardiolipin synthase-like enzyme